MDAQKIRKGLYPLEHRQEELHDLVKHVLKCIRGIESDLPALEGNPATFRVMENMLREMERIRVSATENLERMIEIIEGDSLEATATRDGILYGVREKAEVELSQAGERELEEALIEVEQGQTKEFDNVDSLIKDLTE